MSELFEYQKHLGETVKVYEDRVNWLSQGSKRIFGTITEKMLVTLESFLSLTAVSSAMSTPCAQIYSTSIVIIVDLSLSNINYLVHIQHSLRLLLEQQLCNKDYLNIIT